MPISEQATPAQHSGVRNIMLCQTLLMRTVTLRAAASAVALAGLLAGPAAEAATTQPATETSPARSAPAWRAAEIQPHPAAAGDTIVSVLPQAISCSARGYCAAGGYETLLPGSSSDSPRVAIVATESRGHWSRFAVLQLPADAATANLTDQVTGASCPAAGDCFAVGDYTATVGVGTQNLGFIATEPAGKVGHGDRRHAAGNRERP